MGHVLKGSREAYFDEKDVNLIKEQYLKCDFTREIPESNHVRMKSEIEQLRQENLTLHQRIDMIENLLRKYMKEKSG
jgi:acyl-CoA thioesterase FadM